MRLRSTALAPLLAICLLVSMAMDCNKSGNTNGPPPDKGQQALVVSLRLAFLAAGPTIEAFKSAGKLTAQQAQDLQADFDAFSPDVTDLVSATDLAGRVRAIEALADRFIAAGPHFKLPNLEANVRFQAVYAIVKGVIRSAELYFGVTSPKVDTIPSTGPQAKALPDNRRPTTAQLQAKIDQLRAELEKK